jgi:phosphoglycolate phosphatase
VRPPRAIVFDLDGTLVDSRGDIAAACNHALAALGHVALPEAEIARFVGDGSRMLLARALRLDPKEEGEIDVALDAFNRYYTAYPATYSRWMPGARDVLDALSSLPLALATNKPRGATMALLDALGAVTFFRAIVAGGDGPLKPNPYAIRAALAPLDVAAHNAWVVGDGVQDVGAARAAGAVSVAVLGGFASDEALRASSPDVILPAISDLPPLVARALSSVDRSL